MSSLSIPRIDPTGTGAQNWWAATHAQLGSLADGTHDTSGHCRSRHGPAPSSEADFREYSAKHELRPSATNAWELHTMRWEPSHRGHRGNSRRGTRLSQRGVNARRGPLTPRTTPNKTLQGKQPPPRPVLAAPPARGAPDSPSAGSRAEQAKALGASTKRASQWSSRNLVQSPEPPRAASHKPIGSAAAKNADTAPGSPEATRPSHQLSSQPNQPTGTAPLLQSGSSSVLPAIRPAPAAEKANIEKAFEILLGVGADGGSFQPSNPSSRPAAPQQARKPQRVSSGAARPATYTPGAMRQNKQDPQNSKARAATVSTLSRSSPRNSGNGTARESDKVKHPVGANAREMSYGNAIAELDGIVQRSGMEGPESADGGDELPLMPDYHGDMARMRTSRGGAGNQKRYVECVLSCHANDGGWF